MNKRSKIITLCALVVSLLAADSMLTARIVSSKFLPARNMREASALVEPDAIRRFRTQREQLVARQEAQLNDIIHDERSTEAIVNQAQSRLLELLEQTRTEQTLEGILQARGFVDALATVRNGSANILFRTGALTQRQSSVILDLIMRETGITAGNVKIIPIK